MLTLVPGVVAQGGTYGNAVSNQAGRRRTNAIGFGNYAIGGGFGNQSSFYIDGVASNAPPAISIPHPLSGRSARVPRRHQQCCRRVWDYAGGIVNLTTKSETTHFTDRLTNILRNKGAKRE
jgi:hypothetical protein